MFKQARLKLTAWYLLIIMLVSLSFSVFIYEMLSREVERFARVQHVRIARRLQPNMAIIDLPLLSLPQEEQDLISDSRQRIVFMLGTINVVIFIFSGGLGYLLAGKTLHPIKDMVDEQNRFITDASHELRTPLTSLKSAMEVALRDKNMSLSEAKNLIIDSIQETNKLQQLTEDLLQISQHTQLSEYRFEEIALKDLASTAIHQIQPLAKSKFIALENKIEEDKVYVNRKGIVDVLVILLDNAIKYSPEKSLITLSSRKAEKHILLSIADQGLGIEEKDMPHIFDRFYRSDTARMKGASKGFGLGLSIAQRIINLHKGKISVKSSVGKGSIFTVSIPEYRAHTA